MDTTRRESIRRSLRSLAEAHAATMEIMERTYTLLCEELALDPADYFAQRGAPRPTTDPQRPGIDRSRFSVTFRGRTCFLGNTLPFRLFAFLYSRTDTYVTHEELLSNVWDGRRSDDAVRSVVKTLRQKLREARLVELADAIDGSISGHYALRLPQ